MLQSWTLLEKPELPMVLDLAPSNHQLSMFSAWRCTWEIIDGHKADNGGVTYAISRTLLANFVNSLEKVVDPENPKLHLRSTAIQYVKVSREMFEELISKTAKVIHNNHGFHLGDLEPFTS